MCKLNNMPQHIQYPICLLNLTNKLKSKKLFYLALGLQVFLGVWALSAGSSQVKNPTIIPRSVRTVNVHWGLANLKPLLCDVGAAILIQEHWEALLWGQGVNWLSLHHMDSHLSQLASG